MAGPCALRGAGESERHSTTAATGFIPTLIPMQSARPRATFRSRRSTCAGRRARSSSVKVRAQLSQLGVGAIERAFLSVFGHMKGHVCQRGRRNRQTQVMVYRMGISMEPVGRSDLHRAGTSADGRIGGFVRFWPPSLCFHGPGEPSGGSVRPRGGSLRPDGVRAA